MCGIFAAINGQSVTQSLMLGLDALSYRGYDSAGIAVIGRKGLERRRAKGKLTSLMRLLKSSPLEGSIGIAHTRWATHGNPNETNAHPHMTSRVAVAHNGIIENYAALREQLEQEGYLFQSETDSETIPLLITQNLDLGMNHTQAIRKALMSLDGSFAIAAVFNDQADILYAARQGSPLVIGATKGGFYIASDANALGHKAEAVCHLEDGDLATISRTEIHITNLNGQPINRVMKPINTQSKNTGRNGYPHYMLKEIHEQPETFRRSIVHYLDNSQQRLVLPTLPFILEHLKRMAIIACGTSYYAGMVGKYWLEGFAALPVDIDIASEYRYRNAPLNHDEAALFISQSGETADTLAALQHAREAKQPTISIINVFNSSMARQSDALLPTMAGAEIGVASTKAFTSQLAVMLMLTLEFAYINKRIDSEQQTYLIQQILELPKLMSTFLHDDKTIQHIASQLYQTKDMLYLGRGIAFPLALEGALKLKEISYIHAEAYPAGELKHGPIALIDKQMPVLVIAPPGPLFNKTLSNLREVASRGARIVLISNQAGIESAKDFIEHAIVMPEVEPLLQPVLYTLPLQLLAYHIAVFKGTNVDQPRNLAKSVTVE